LDGVSYTAAVAQRCGQPALQMAVANVRPDEFAETIEFVVMETPTEVMPEETAEATTEVDGADGEEDTTPTTVPTDEPEVVETPEAEDESPFEITLAAGDAGLVIANRDFDSSSIFLVQDRTFCRLGHGDFYSWLLPSLVMIDNNIDPYTAPAEIVDYDDIPSLVQAVADGDCDASGISQSTYNALEDTSGISIIETTIDFPYGIFMYPLEVELGVRLSLTKDMIEFADDLQVSRPLRLLLGQDAIVEVLPGDLDELDAFMIDTGFDFAQMGN